MSQASMPSQPAKALEPSQGASVKPVLTLTDMVASAAINLKRVELAKSILGVAIFVSSAVLVLVLIDHWVWPLPAIVRWLSLLTVGTASVYWLARRLLPMFGRQINPIYAAREIERKVPELKDSLVSYMQLNESQQAAPKSIVTAVGRFAVERLSRHDIGEFIASTTPLKLAMWLFFILVFSGVYFVVSPKSGFDSLLRLIMPWQAIEVPSRVKIVKLSPKDVVVARGQTITVDVELRGYVSGDEVAIEFSTLDGQFVDRKIPMQPQVEGLTYTGKLTSGESGIQQSLEYVVRAGDAVAGPYRVDVELVPLVGIERLELTYPKYTKLAPQTIEDPSGFEALEGSFVKVFAQGNQAMDSGRIEINPEAAVDDPLNIRRLQSMGTKDRSLVGAFQVHLNKKRENPSPTTYRITAVSALGQPNSDPLVYSFDATSDLPPKIQWLTDYPEAMEIPVNHAADFSLQASDTDFGLAQMRTSLLRGRSKLDDNILLLNEEGIFAEVDRTWRFEPAKMGLRPGDELTLQAFAADNRRDLQEARWEPNISSTRIIKIKIQRESNQATEFSAKPEEMPKLPDEPVDGSDIQQKQPEEPEPKSEGENAADPKTSDAESQDAGNDSAETLTEPSNNENAENEGQQGEKSSESTPDNASETGKEQEADGSDASGQEDSASGSQSSDGNSSEQPGNEQTSNDPQKGDSSSAAEKPSEKNQGQSQNGVQQKGEQKNSGNKQEDSGQQSGSESGAGEPGESQSGGESDGNQSGNSQSGAQSPSSGNASSDSPSNGGQSAESGNQSKAQGGQSKPNSSAGSSQRNSSNSQGASGNASTQQNSSRTNNGNASSASKAQGGSSDNSKNTSQSGAEASEGTGTESSNEGSGQDGSASENESSNKPSTGASGKGRLDKVEQSTGGPSSPLDDGDAFEEIQEWMKENGISRSTDDPNADFTESDPNASKSQNSDSTTSGNNRNQDDASSKNGNEPAASKTANPKTEASDADDSNSNDVAQRDAANQPAGDQGSTGQGKGGNSKPGTSKDQTGDKPSNASGSQQAGAGGEEQAPGAGNEQQAGASSGQPSSKSESPQAQTSKDPSNTSGEGGTAAGGSNSKQTPSGGATAGESAANLEYTKKTTDMALDFLDRQRDQPDPELLERLGWTSDDLKNFVDRWKAAKEKGTAQNGMNEDYMQDLRALGLMPTDANKKSGTEVNDRLEGLREQGRSKPPRTLQSQYETFRKAAQRRAAEKE